jgi:soluble lytic murein transglycosylase-like protein
MSARTTPHRLQARVERDGVVVAEGVFDGAFIVGRGDGAGLRIDDLLVSREHAEIAFTAGCWWVRDLDSANGTYVGGRRVVEMPIEGSARVELGLGGPVVEIEELQGDAAAEVDPSLTQVIGHYFAEKTGPSGERTQLIRDAYKRVHRSHKRRVQVIVATSVVLLAAAVGVALLERARVKRLEALAQDLFVEMRAQDRQVALLRRLLAGTDEAGIQAMLDAAAERGDAAVGTDSAGAVVVGPGETRRPARRRVDAGQLQALIAEAETRRQRIESQYDAFVEDLGVYRDATPQEQEILRVARLFNESEFAVPAGFVEEVQGTIAWWRSHGLAGSVQRAEANGYTPVIVETMRRHGLPPEFFYLALVESHFDEAAAIGPATRWGIAKGIWQFIPTTAQDYGLTIGPLAGERVYDPADERFDFPLATNAAAQYLLKLYTDISQASGLLAMASYNWGEGRVLPRLRNLPAPSRDATPLELAEEQLAAIPQDPQQRSYWRFLTTYGPQMPEETRNYVLRIFAAAVIGRNPRLFGFNFDNPLARYMG